MKPLKILSVDDNQQNLKLIESTLLNHFEVLSSDGNEALTDLVNRFEPDVILLDIMLTGKSGYDLCRELRNSGMCPNAVVIFISSLNSLEDKLTAYAAGGDDYICKPIDIQELDKKLYSLEKRFNQQHQLEAQMESATEAAFSSMQQSSELGLLIHFFNETLEINDVTRLYQACKVFVASFDCTCSMEFRVDKQIIQLPCDEGARLESEILALGRSAKRVVTFGRNLLLNSPWCSVLIKKMPQHDEALCGRLRDHFTILLGIINSRLMLIESESQRAMERQNAMLRLSSALDGGFNRIQEKMTEQEHQAEVILQKLETALNITLVSLGLTETQEAALFGIVNDTRDEFKNMMDISVTIDNEIHNIDHLLHKVSEKNG